VGSRKVRHVLFARERHRNTDEFEPSLRPPFPLPDLPGAISQIQISAAPDHALRRDEQIGIAAVVEAANEATHADQFPRFDDPMQEIGPHEPAVPTHGAADVLEFKIEARTGAGPADVQPGFAISAQVQAIFQAMIGKPAVNVHVLTGPDGGEIGRRGCLSEQRLHSDAGAVFDRKVSKFSGAPCWHDKI
jgi:hypothetical protein